MKILFYSSILKPYTITLAISFSLVACSDFIEIDLPKNEITTESVFLDEKSATAAMLGVYSQVMESTPELISGGMSVFTGLTSDELSNTNTTIANQNQFFQNSVLTNNTNNNNFWVYGYRYIYQVNNVLEGIAASKTLNQQTVDQLTGEAKFTRALLYFYLVNLFGDVPLTTTTDYKVNSRMGRTASSQIHELIVADLKEASSLLPVTYASTGRVRPNKWAATALLARVYLYQKDWANAELKATEVVNSGLYTLEPNLNDTFLASSREAIWQLMPSSPGINTTEARQFIPSSSATVRPNFALTTNVLNAFTTGDIRRTAWVGSKTVSGTTFYYPTKYKVNGVGLPVTEYYAVLRIAEQYLIRSEARSMQNKVSEAQADLNMIRKRAQLANTTATTQATLLAAIEKERQVELMTEWGHRWFDLKRTGRIDAVLTVSKPGWQPSDALFPIPLAQINQNPALTQNPGY